MRDREHGAKEGAYRVNLSAAPVIDAHTHLIYPRYHEHDLARTLSLSLEDPPDDQVRSGLLYHKVLGELSRLWGGSAHGEEAEAASTERRKRMLADYEGYVGELFRDVNIRGLVVDLGYKPAAAPVEEFEKVVRVQAVYLYRIEGLLDELWRERPSFDMAEERFRAALDGAVPGEHVGCKTIIGYRTGLEVGRASRGDAAAAWAAGDEKTIRDYFVLLTLEQCRRLGCPIQIHTGFGESNIDLRRNNPLHLKALLESEAARGVRITLVHGGYPHSFEAGYLAAMYPNVYVDLSEGIPWVVTDIQGILRRVMGIAPLNKIMFGSDGFIIPEICWIAAKLIKEALGAELGSLVAGRYLSPARAERAATDILGRTAAGLFGLSSG
jgi:hypothetical protein